MIVIEDRFEEMIEYLPSMTRADGTGSFKPTFGFGDGKELNAFLQRTEGDTEDPYPLIWMLYPQEEIHTVNTVKLNSVSFILAVKTTTDKLNKQRFDETFRPVIFQLVDNLLELFKKSNTISTIKDHKLTKFPNYGELNVLRTREQFFTTDIWDAVKVVFNCEINNNCLRVIKF